ncbi:MAG: putative toxin-antitoxin system toxin component, PIN family [Peptococcaceae bacterium]|nr:putative toxin-antitoxin system toxin component, PIN family [Peptococcaceae bacterium]
MRILIDTNVLFSAFILSSRHILQLIDHVSEHHTIVLSTYIIDELKRVTKQKFPEKYNALEALFQELPYELIYTPERIDKEEYPYIRDKKDLPILVSAIIGEVDVLITGDNDFAPVITQNPEIMTPRSFIEKYG